MNKCDVCGQDVSEVYITFDNNMQNVVSGHKRCIMQITGPQGKSMSMHPFADEEEIERLREERDRLINSLSEYAIPEDEQRFIIRKIKNITEKLVEKARYAKDLK